MPVTARLSKLFYERLGEQVANELVEWFNAVDTDYRGQLRELNELNFARFDAKLEQRIAELRSELTGKIDRLNAELTARIDRVVAALTGKIESVAAQLTATLERRLGEQTRWLFVAWATLLIPVIGMWVRK